MNNNYADDTADASSYDGGGDNMFTTTMMMMPMPTTEASLSYKTAAAPSSTSSSLMKNFAVAVAPSSSSSSSSFPLFKNIDVMNLVAMNTSNLTNPFLLQDPQQQPQGGIFSRTTGNGDTSFDDLMKILDSAEDVMNSSSLSLSSLPQEENNIKKRKIEDDQEDPFFSLALEPTPLGPQGGGLQGRRLAQELPKQEQDDLLQVLNPLLLFSSFDHDTTTPYVSVSKPQKNNMNNKRRRVSPPSSPSPPTSPRAVRMVEEVPSSSSPSSSPKKDDDTNNTTTTCNTNDKDRFRPYQFDQWKIKYQELVDYKSSKGNCLVPHSYPPNQQLAQWIKRQRYQFRLKGQGRHSTLTQERQQLLESLGFIWHSHNLAWAEHYEELKLFKQQHGHCCVPSNHNDKGLAIWVKGQRRQYKLWIIQRQEDNDDGDMPTINNKKTNKKKKKSTMTQSRYEQLESIGFDWNPRNL